MGVQSTPERWLEVAADREFLDEAERRDPAVAGDVEHLRRAWSPEQIRVAFELVEARRRGAAKFTCADAMLADREGMQQATDARVADHKVARFRALGGDEVLDLCCGIGGDAMSLGRVAAVDAVDRDPVRACMADHNGRLVGADVRAAVADVGEIDVRGRVVHIDPSRRAGGRRRWSFDDYEPGPEFLRRLTENGHATAIKLGPGVDPSSLPPGELEFISNDGRLVQAVLWTGEFAGDERSATRLPGGQTLSGAPAEGLPTSEGEFRRYLCEPDPALERAGLIAAHPAADSLAEPARGLGLWTTDTGPDDWFTTFEVHEVLPWRAKKVAAWLAAHDAGSVEVKTRGAAVDPEKARRELSASGSVPFTVFVLRLGKAKKAIITLRASAVSR